MFSRLIRRTHMFLALFLFPWVLMYALSTLAMNHRTLFTRIYGSGPVPFEKERLIVYGDSFPENAGPETMARQILIATGLDGAHGVTRRNDGAIVITRNGLVTPHRLTYSPADHTLLVEKATPRFNAFLERFHRRRGYATGYRLDTLWAITVDLAIASMVFWVASGLWMWWEMKVTRVLGAAAVLSGAGLFAVYLLTL